MVFNTPEIAGPAGRTSASAGTLNGLASRLDHDFAVGLEEEYFLACARTLTPAEETPALLFGPDDKGLFQHEMLQAQLEVSTAPHADFGAARSELARLRQAAASAASRHGLVILAAGTHPTARWERVQPTDKVRYDEVLDELQMIGRRNMLCGLHVHVSVPDTLSRVEIMNRAVPYVPALLALSTSSPFWQGQNTGLKGYRLAAYDELPRTGLPDLFETDAEYQAYIDALVRSGVMKDSSYVWWAIRPSAKYPTLELRAPDCCTRIDDAIAIAALYRCLVRSLCRLPAEPAAALTPLSRALAVENKWRAQRYGIHGTFATESGAVSVADFVSTLIDFLDEDATALNCQEELDHCRAILKRGTSADEQIRVFEETAARQGEEQGLRAVTEWLRATTLEL